MWCGVMQATSWGDTAVPLLSFSSDPPRRTLTHPARTDLKRLLALAGSSWEPMNSQVWKAMQAAKQATGIKTWGCVQRGAVWKLVRGSGARVACVVVVVVVEGECQNGNIHSGFSLK